LSISSTIKKILRKIPRVDKYFRRREFNKKYAVEKALFNNESVRGGEGTSILHFSINKAATQHVKKVLRKLAAENNLVPVHLHGYAFSVDKPYLDHLSEQEMESYKHIFKPRGFLYTVFGGMIKNIDSLSSYKILLTIRDPRDILVSGYYSAAYSHPIPPQESGKREAFLAKRNEVRKKSIDEFVLERSERVQDTFIAYQNRLVSKYNNVILLKYEQMATDYEGWLDTLSRQLQLTMSSGLKTQLIEANKQQAAKSEDKHRHRRKGQPGDYKEKLKPATIRQLNKQLKPVLDAFGYEDC